MSAHRSTIPVVILVGTLGLAIGYVAGMIDSSTFDRPEARDPVVVDDRAGRDEPTEQDQSGRVDGRQNTSRVTGTAARGPDPNAIGSLRSPATAQGGIEALRHRDLLLPVDEVRPADLRPSFMEARSEGRHEALDIPAPRGTPVRAVEDGTIEKLFESKRGGLTIYQFDPTRRFAYYYAHLDRYAEGLREGQAVSRGSILGYVGTTGNASPETPHLHFAIFVLTPERQWWKGTAIDPILVWRERVD